MNKTFKGAGAAVAAGVLLLGGAGSLAYWTDTADVTASDLETGTLELGAVTGGAWKLNNGSVDISTVEIVPGDILEYTGTVPVEVTGDNLQGNLTAEWTDLADVTGLTGLTTTTTATFNGATLSGDGVTFNDEDNGESIAFSIVVDYPFGSGSPEPAPADPVTVDLSNITIDMEQTDASAP